MSLFGPGVERGREREREREATFDASKFAGTWVSRVCTIEHLTHASLLRVSGTSSCCGFGPDKIRGSPDEVKEMYIAKLESELEAHREAAFNDIFHAIFEKYKRHKGQRDVIETELEKKLRKCSASDLSIELAGIDKEVAKWQTRYSQIAAFWERLPQHQAFCRTASDELQRSWMQTMEDEIGDEDLEEDTLSQGTVNSITSPGSPGSPAKHWRQSLRKFTDTKARWESRVAPSSPVRSISSVSSIGIGDPDEEAD